MIKHITRIFGIETASRAYKKILSKGQRSEKRPNPGLLPCLVSQLALLAESRSK